MSVLKMYAWIKRKNCVQGLIEDLRHIFPRRVTSRVVTVLPFESQTSLTKMKSPIVRVPSVKYIKGFTGDKISLSCPTKTNHAKK